MRPALLLALAFSLSAQPWRRHTIDNTSAGADGVRIVQRQPLQLVTGWEEGGLVRLYTQAGQGWHKQDVGPAPDVEDAVSAFGYIISASEGKTRALWAHHQHNGQWTTEKIPAADGLMQWMYTLPVGDKLFAGGKGPHAKVGYFQTAKQLKDWRWTPLVDAGWIMSMVATDMDDDGDLDVLISDRHGAGAGAYWLEAPTWRQHRIGPLREKSMFLTRSEDERVIVATQPSSLVIHQHKAGAWQTSEVALPPIAGIAKAVRYFGRDDDGQAQFVVTCEKAQAPKHGVFLMKLDGTWKPVSGVDGVKHDLIELLDLDADGDLDILTTEEVTGLGLIWYENPAPRRR